MLRWVDVGPGEVPFATYCSAVIDPPTEVFLSKGYSVRENEGLGPVLLFETKMCQALQFLVTEFCRCGTSS